MDGHPGAVDDSIAALKLRGVYKSFSGTLALDNVDFCVNRGEIHALLGENGAGKSTLIKILTGVTRPDAGEILVNGRTVKFAKPGDATKSGITALPQDVVAVPHLSVGRNILFGLERPWATVDSLNQQEIELVEFALKQVGATFSHGIAARELSIPNLRLAQIARTMLHIGNIIVLDEPTAVLSEPEADTLLQHLVSFRGHGKAIVYVTHRLSEVIQVADRVTILRDGRCVGRLSRGKFDRQKIVELMTKTYSASQSVIDTASKSAGFQRAMKLHTSDTALSVTELSWGNRFSRVTFAAHTGQIVGIAGVQGSGHAEILRCLSGLQPWKTGEVRAFGKHLRAGSIASAFENGVVLVPADRRKSAIVPDLSIQENLAINRSVRRLCRRFGIRWMAQETKMVMGHIQGLSIRPPRPHMRTGHLSGGNQQKVALARILEGDPQILLLDEPTQGIDVNSKAEIHELLRRAADNGRTILIASSEFEELIGLADVIHVMRLGHLTATLPGQSVSYREILHWALP